MGSNAQSRVEYKTKDYPNVCVRRLRCVIAVHSRYHAEHAEAGKLSGLMNYVFSSVFNLQSEHACSFSVYLSVILLDQWKQLY